MSFQKFVRITLLIVTLSVLAIYTIGCNVFDSKNNDTGNKDETPIEDEEDIPAPV